MYSPAYVNLHSFCTWIFKYYSGSRLYAFIMQVKWTVSVRGSLCNLDCVILTWTNTSQISFKLYINLRPFWGFLWIFLKYVNLRNQCSWPIMVKRKDLKKKTNILNVYILWYVINFSKKISVLFLLTVVCVSCIRCGLNQYMFIAFESQCLTPVSMQ